MQKFTLLKVGLFLLLGIMSSALWGQTTTFTYTGSVQSFTAPHTGKYQLEVWGAQGGAASSYTGGLGGYTGGEVTLTAGQTISVYVGEQGHAPSAGTAWNGGGAGTCCGAGGGGATDIRIGGTTLSNRIIVAGVGGGGSNDVPVGNGGAGGGLSGIQGSSDATYPSSYPGTQTTGNALGVGESNFSDSGGGGSGYWGGGAGTDPSGGSGGGGSAYIGGVTSGTTIVGNATMPNPAGGTMTGRAGHGIAVVTVLCDQLNINTSPATDVCPGTMVTLNATSVNGGTITWDNGVSNGVAFAATTTTTYTATSTHVDDCTGSVTISVDDENPEATCIDDIIYLDENGTTTIIADDLDDGSTDNIGITSKQLSKSTFDCSNLALENKTCLRFDGVDDRVEVNKAVIPTSGDYTITVWVKSEPGQSGFREILSQEGPNSFYLGKQPDGRMRVGAWWNNDVDFPEDGEWHHFGAVKTSLGTKLYMDGQLKASTTTVVANPQGSVFRIAQQHDPYGENLAADIDEITVWNTAKTSSDIRNLINGSPQGNEPGLVAYYNMEQMVGGTNLTDVTGNGNDGALMNMDAPNAWVEEFNPFAVVTLTVTDNCGNADSCISKITVIDNSAPTVLAHDTTLFLNSDGFAYLSTGGVDAGSTDNCGIDTMYLSQDTFDCGDVGFFMPPPPATVGLKSAKVDEGPGGVMVLLTVEDGSGNSDSDWFNVTVLDTISPTVLCKDTAIYLDETGNVAIDSTFIDYGSSDACGIESMTLDVSTFDCSNVGANSVVMTVTDVNGNFSTCNSTVAVSDTIAPVINCPSNISVSNDAGVCGAIVHYNWPVVNDNCSNKKNILLNGDASQGLSGWTILQQGGSGWSANGQFTTSYVDNRKSQEIDLVAAGYSTSYLDSIPEIVIGETIGGIIYSWIPIQAGDDYYYVRYELRGENHNVIATYSSGTPSSPKRVGSDLIDEQAVFNGYGTGVRYIYVEHGGYDYGAWAGHYGAYFRNCHVLIAPEPQLISGLTSGAVFLVGTTTNTFLTTDAAGNDASCSFDVTVVDTISPVVLCQDTLVYLDETGKAHIDTSFVYIGSDDACGVALVTLNKSNFDGSNAGANLVTLSVTDVNGNVSTCTSTVTVKDTIAPVALCHNIGIALDEEGRAKVYPSFIDDGSTDEGGIVSYSLDVSRFTCADVGKNTVVMSVRDVGGNVSTCSSTVTVNDSWLPEVACKDIEVSLNAEGIVIIDSSMIDNGSTAMCGISGIELSQSIFTGADLGENSVTMTVTNLSGISASCEAKVIVKDEIAPVANCNSIDVWLSDSSVYVLSADDVILITNGSSDNASDNDSLQIEITPTTFDCSNLGDSIAIEVSITDEAGNETSCETMVYVNDSTEVQLSSLEDIEISLAAGVCEASINYPEVFNAKPCATFTQLEGLGADSLFPVGTTVETWEVAYGDLKDTVSFSVIVTSENAVPTIGSIADVIANEDTPVSVSLNGISGGNDCIAQDVTVVATTLNTALVTGIEVAYTAGDTTGMLNITLAANESGTDTITVVVEDSEGAKTSKMFALDVAPINDAPVLLTQLEDVELKANDTVSISIPTLLGTVFDDVDDSTLVYRLTMTDTKEAPSWLSISEMDDELLIGLHPLQADTGCYNVILEATDPAGAMASDTFEVCVKEVIVGINDVNNSIFDVHMYPNPSRGMVTLDLNTSFTGGAELYVMSITGQQVFHKTYLSGDRIEFDLSDQVSGSYLVILQAEGGRVVKKLILDKK